MTFYQKIGGTGKKIRTQHYSRLVGESIGCQLVTGTNCLLGGGKKLGQLQFNLRKMGEQAIDRTDILTAQTSIHLDESHNKNRPSIAISG